MYMNNPSSGQLQARIEAADMPWETSDGWVERTHRDRQQSRRAGGERAAAIYTLIDTAKLNGLDPEAYLRHVIGRIAGHPVNRVDELVPWNVAIEFASPEPQAAAA